MAQIEQLWRDSQLLSNMICDLTIQNRTSKLLTAQYVITYIQALIWSALRLSPADIAFHFTRIKGLLAG